MNVIETDRLLLRAWQQADRQPFAEMNADELVMEYFPKPLTSSESDGLVDHIERHFKQHQFGLWAAEVKETRTFAGFIGLQVPGFEAHFTPCVEIGWRLAYPFWGQGFAPEGARAVLDFAFNVAQLDEVVSMTTVENQRSRRVMEKLGMTHTTSEDFEHPSLPEGHPLRPHVLYRLSKKRWLSNQE